MEQGLIGLHVSRDYVKKGTIEQNIEAAKKRFGLKTLKVVQVFLGSPRTFKISLTKLDEKSLKTFIHKNKMDVYAHAPYPLAIFSQAVKPSTLGFAKHLFNVAERSGVIGVVLHLYKYPANIVIDTLKNLQLNKNVKIVLETPATSPMNAIYNTPEALYEVYKKAKENNINNVGICIDTCHIYVSGLDITEPYIMEDYMKKLVKLIPSKDLLIHLNDSGANLGSGKDRHASVGYGYIWGKSTKSLKILLDFITRYQISTILERNEGNGSIKDDYEIIKQNI